jgi:hypothetical protein
MTATIVIQGPSDKAKAADWIKRAPDGSKVTFMRPEERRKTRPQENKFHAMVRDVAAQVEHNKEKLDEAEWKKLFLDALRRESRIVRSLDGRGFVDLGWASTSSLNTTQYTDLIMIVQAYGDSHDVKFKSDTGLEPTRR